MAFLRVYSTAGAKIAEVIVPDTALPRLQAAFGGGTAPQTAQNVLEWVYPALRAETRKRILGLKWTADYAAVAANQVTEEATFDGDMP